MQRSCRRRSAIVVAAVLLVVLALGGGAALAEVGNWWQGGNNTLTVIATNSDDLKEDIAKADVVVDVVQIGTATPNANYEAFDYELLEGFSELNLPANPTQGDWQALADGAAALAKLTPDGSVAADAPLAGLADGVYLVLAHEKGKTDSLAATSELHTYTFAPSLVVLPSNDAAGGWVTDVKVALKPEQGDLYGSLRIKKTVQNFSGEPATFVFHLVGTEPSGKAYDEHKSIYFTGGTEEELVVDGIPAGTKLTVTEEFEGTRYEMVSGDSEEKTIIADEMVDANNPMPEAAFVNAPNNSGKGGHGVENKFELTKTGEGDSDWDWTWTALPKEAAVESGENQ